MTNDIFIIFKIEKQIRDCLKEDKSDDINEDLEQQLISLRELEKTEFPGPVYDCLLFHDGENWNAIVDTTELGDLRSLEPMVDYRLKRQFSRFSDDDCLNFSVNIYDDGNILSIVVDSGSHGTHVAGIVGAYFPDNTESNGVAPGAQLISLKIGDSRLGSMETGVGLVRALLEAKNRGCNIINMSFGGILICFYFNFLVFVTNLLLPMNCWQRPQPGITMENSFEWPMNWFEIMESCLFLLLEIMDPHCRQ